MKKIENVDVNNVFFASVFNDKVCQQVSEASMPDERIQTEILLTIQEKKGRDHFDK